jgi:hypothetical protein
VVALLSISICRCFGFGFSLLAKRLRQAVFVQLRVALGDFFNEILVKLASMVFTRVPISKRMGGAEKATIFSRDRSECMDLVSWR